MMNLVFVLAVYSFSTGSFFHLVFGLLCTVKNLLPKRNKEAHMLIFFVCFLSEKSSGIIVRAIFVCTFSQPLRLSLSPWSTC